MVRLKNTASVILFTALLSPIPPQPLAFAANPPATTTAPATEPATEPAVINVRDFGARGDGVADDAPAINHAISVAIAANRPIVLIIPAGRYRLDATPGKPDHLAVYHADSLTIRGEAGSVLVAHDPDTHILALYACRNVKLSTLTLEQAKPCFTQGVITAVDAKAPACDVAIDDGFDEPDAPLLANMRSFRPFPYADTAACQAERFFPQVNSQQRIGARTWRLTLDSRLDPALAGKKFMLRDSRHRSRAISGGYDENCVIEDVVYLGHGAGAMFDLPNCRGTMIFRRCSADVPAGSADLVSCEGGGRLANLRGSALFDHCVFDRIDDDGVSLTTSYVRVIVQIDSHTLQLQRNPGFEPGDTLAILDWPRKAERSQAKIAAVLSKSDRTCVVTLDRDTPIGRAGAGDGKLWGSEARNDGIDRVADYALACSSAVFRDCRLRSLHGRALNLCSQNSLIEGCTFLDCEAPAIAAGPDFYWEDAPAIHNLAIRNNHFINCNASNIDVDAFQADKDAGSFDNRTILIEGNTFERFGAHSTALRAIAGCAIHIRCADGVIIRGNTLRDPGQAVAAKQPRVVLDRTRNVTIGKNEGLPDTAVQRK